MQNQNIEFSQELFLKEKIVSNPFTKGSLQNTDKGENPFIVYPKNSNEELNNNNQTQIEETRSLMRLSLKNINIKEIEQKTDEKESHPKYVPISFRGAGAFGYVVEAYDLKNDNRVAIKRTHKVGSKLSREYKILTELKGCPNTVEMLDAFYTINDEGAIVQNIVFEYVSNSLENEIEKLKKERNFFEYNELCSIFSQILNGLVFCKSKNIVHRDLKPENVLYTSDKRVKICDFGSSKIILPLHTSEYNSNSYLKSLDKINKVGLKQDNFFNCGVKTKSTPYIVSRYYRSPELILGCDSYDSCIDIFAAGCIFFELSTLMPLFPGRIEGMQLFEQMSILGSMPKGYLSSFPSGKVLNEVINKITHLDVLDISNLLKINNNLTLEMILDLKDLIMKMICWWPNERITADKALNLNFFKNNYK